MRRRRTVVLTHFLIAYEKLTAGKLVGVALGFAGVVAMIGGAALQGLGGNLSAQFAVLAAAFTYGLAGIFGRRFCCW